MAESTVVVAAINPDLKSEAERVFSDLGLTAAEAITLFYEQVADQRKVPFPVLMPNAETVDALNEARDRVGLVEYANFDELIEDIE